MDLEREKTYAYVHGKEEGLAEGHEKGLKEGAHEKAVEAARKLLKMNVGTVEQIAEATGLSPDEVLTLKNVL